MQLAGGAEVRAQRAEAGAQQFVGDGIVFQREVHAHEEQLRFGVAELVGIDDVTAVFGQKALDPQHDAALVEAGQGQDIFRSRHEKSP